jgi:hypothetical protein
MDEDLDVWRSHSLRYRSSFESRQDIDRTG